MTNTVSQTRAEESPATNWVVPLLLTYLWFFMTTPYTRFPILTEIRFERILVVFVILVALFGGSLTLRMTRTSRWVLLMFGWMLLSWVMSPSPHFYLAEQWLESYWKLVLFHLLFLWCLTSLRDVSGVLIGVAVVAGLYQAHSWWDFLNGGSHVYQQGIKRIVGVWTQSGKGAGNAFGFLALVSLPFVEYAIQAVRGKKYKLLFVGIGGMSLASILFSGTRAALVGLLLFGLIHFRSRRTIGIGVLMMLVLAVVVYYLPADLKERHGTIFGAESESGTIKDHETSVRSGQTRLEGMRDGYRLASERPLLGYGPGVSMLARFAINPTPFREGSVQMLQLHNLYGQIMAELGFPGLLLFGLLLLSFFRSLNEIKELAEGDEQHEIRVGWMIVALKQGMLVLLFYGMFSHTLYRYNWLLLFGIQGALLSIELERLPARMPRVRSPQGMTRPSSMRT